MDVEDSKEWGEGISKKKKERKGGRVVPVSFSCSLYFYSLAGRETKECDKMPILFELN